jgi:hypothetical protein
MEVGITKKIPILFLFTLLLFPRISLALDLIKAAESLNVEAVKNLLQDDKNLPPGAIINKALVAVAQVKPGLIKSFTGQTLVFNYVPYKELDIVEEGSAKSGKDGQILIINMLLEKITSSQFENAFNQIAGCKNKYENPAVFSMLLEYFNKFFKNNVEKKYNVVRYAIGLAAARGNLKTIEILMDSEILPMNVAIDHVFYEACVGDNVESVMMVLNKYHNFIGYNEFEAGFLEAAENDSVKVLGLFLRLFSIKEQLINKALENKLNDMSKELDVNLSIPIDRIISNDVPTIEAAIYEVMERFGPYIDEQEVKCPGIPTIYQTLVLLLEEKKNAQALVNTTINVNMM